MDKDLASIQNARELLRRSQVAQKQFASATQEQVDRIVDAMARIATDHAEELARLAVEESGFGRVESKTAKNKFVSVRLHQAYRNLRTCGVIRRDDAQGIIEIAAPVGVVAGIIPITNPTSTAIFKILIALKGRNSIVLSPHPFGVRCISRSAQLLARAAEAAGAPKDVILCMDTPTLDGTNELMRNDITSVIVATGGPGVVKAAYSSGKPAFGVGPGNPPVFVHESADLDHAARCIAISQGFDFGTICSSEQSLVVQSSVAEPFREALRRAGAHICSREEIRLLQQLVQLPTGGLNTKIVGQSPARLAEMAGFAVDAACTALVAAEQGVGLEYPLSREKLAPILAWYEVSEWKTGCELCIDLIEYDGAGHTMGIYCRDPEVILAFGVEKPVARIIANGPSTQGSVGYSTDLEPSMTLGCGTMGGNVTSDNIGPKHLLNIKRIAFPSANFFREVGLPLDERDRRPGSGGPEWGSDGGAARGAPTGARPTGARPTGARPTGSAPPASGYGAGTASPEVEAMIARALTGYRLPPSRER